MRRNFHYRKIQLERLGKLARMEGVSVAHLMREANDMLISDRVAKLRAKKRE